MSKYIYLFILFIFPFLLVAQQNTDSTSETVIVTSKFLTTKKSVPNQVLKIQSQQITLSNSSTSADLLQNTGQVFVQRSQTGGGSPVLRGFEANRVMIVVDNVRMNNAIFRSGHLQNVLRVDGNSIQQVEVLFGPGSLIYGSDALGGVMHFRMNQATIHPLEDGEKLKVKGNAQIRFSSVNKELMSHFDVNFSGKKWAALTSFTVADVGDLSQGKKVNPYNKAYPNQFDASFYVERFNDKDSMVKNTSPEIQKRTDFRQYNFMQKFVFDGGKGITHRLNFYATTTSKVNRYDRLTEMSGQNPKFADWYYGPEKWGMLNYQLEVSRKTAVYDNLMVTLAGQHYQESRNSRRFQNSSLKSQIEKVDGISLNIDAIKKGNNGSYLQYGVEGIYNKVGSTAYSQNILTQVEKPADTRYPDGGANMSWFSGYLTGQMILGERFIFQAGGRASYNSLNATFKNKDFFPFPFDNTTQQSFGFVANGSISYVTPKNLRLSALYSSGYRVPNVDDMTKVFESAGGQLIVPNPNLKPEYAHNGEFSFSKIFGKSLKLEANLYYTKLTNAITLGKGQLNGQDSVMYDGTKSGVFTSVNKDKAYIYGAYVGLSAKIVKHVWLTGAWNYTYGRIPTDTTAYPLDHIPPIFGKLGLSYNDGRWQADFYTLFNGWKFKSQYNLVGEDNFQYATPNGTPAWYTLNFKAGFPIDKYLRVLWGVENILDTNYRIFSSGVSAPGRNVFVSFRAEF